MPECYWTKEGLSSLASAIGRPLHTDELTSRMELLPFAKVCVEYTIGNELPCTIEALELDPITNEKRVATVKISYPSKPRFCTHCHALGHIVGACPAVKRNWVRKTIPPSSVPSSQPVESKEQEKAVMGVINNADVSLPSSDPVLVSPAVAKEDINLTDNWRTVQRKRPLSPASFSDSTPPILNTFKSLERVDELDAKRATTTAHLSKSQLKKLKKAGKAAKVLGTPPKQLS